MGGHGTNGLHPRVWSDTLLVIILQSMHLDITPHGLQAGHTVGFLQVEEGGKLRREVVDLDGVFEVERDADLGGDGGGEGEGDAAEGGRFRRVGPLETLNERQRQWG